MTKLAWVETASNHAVVSRDELLLWLEINVAELKNLVDSRSFPVPRFGGASVVRLTKRSRWRAGDVRAWLKSPEHMEAELKVPIGANRTGKNTIPWGGIDRHPYVYTKKDVA